MTREQAREAAAVMLGFADGKEVEACRKRTAKWGFTDDPIFDWECTVQMEGGEMNHPINDGGPAFPLQSIGPEFQPGYSGMTMRDYFAAAAMQGLMAAHTSGGCLVDDLCAKYAYDLADAMLKAREEKP